METVTTSIIEAVAPSISSISDIIFIIIMGSIVMYLFLMAIFNVIFAWIGDKLKWKVSCINIGTTKPMYRGDQYLYAITVKKYKGFVLLKHFMVFDSEDQNYFEAVTKEEIYEKLKTYNNPNLKIKWRS